MGADATETILIVDDEEPVRRTFREWLTGAGLDCTILAAADAESALKLANPQSIDLAILDWALAPATMACNCSKIWRPSIPTSWPS